MRPKFFGLMLMTAMVAVASLGFSGNQEGDGFAGSNPAFAQCGGGGLQYETFASCGRGGLQSYSSCGGGGGSGPGLTFAPAYQPAYVGYGGATNCGPYGCPVTYSLPVYQSAPQYDVQSSPTISAPVTIAPPRANLGLINVTVGQSSPVPLGPSERYVAGSLRRVDDSGPSVERPAAKPLVRVAVRRDALPLGYELLQVTQAGCVPCKKDTDLLAAEGVPVRRVYLDGDKADREEIKRLLSQLEPAAAEDLERVGTPFYIVTRNGYAVHWIDGRFGTPASVASILGAVRDRFESWQTAVAERKASSSTMREDATEQKLDRLADLMKELVKSQSTLVSEMRGLRSAVETAAAR